MFSVEFKVRDYELDMQGIVNNSVYFNYLEHARHEFLLAKGVDFAALARDKINLVVVRSEMDYKASLQILGTTVVLPERADLKPDELRAISVPRGFTPHHLMALQQQFQFEFVETNDAKAALVMVLKGRVDAADVEWNVAQALLKQLDPPAELAVAEKLPISLVGFHLSSKNSAEFIHTFDRFLQREQVAIAQLKQQFQLREQLSDLTTVKHPTDATQH